MESVLDNLDKILGFGFLLLSLGLTVLFVVISRNKTGRTIRQIPAFHRFRREVGLAVEAGKRVHVSLGRGGVNGLAGGAAFVGLSMLERCARAASISDCPPVATSGDGVVTVLSQDTLRGTYRSLGADQRYDPSSGRLSGLSPLAFAAGAMPAIHDEQVSANILAGHFGSEVALLAEAGERSHCLTVAGSDHLTAQAVMYATAQEPLIGEELYAGGAYLGVSSVHNASLHSQDVLRWVLVGAIFIGAILKLTGFWQ